MDDLKPCPFCGFPAKITEVETAPDYERMTITCCGCGVQLNHNRYCVIHDVTDPISGMFLYSIRKFQNDSAIEVWNRRVNNA